MQINVKLNVSPVDTVGSTDAKKLRADSPTRDIQVIQPTVMCPICNSNTASARCSRGTCKKCCLDKHAEEEKAFKEATESTSTGDIEAAHFQPICEMHLEKAKKEQERREQLKAHRQAKKERARELQHVEKSQKEARQAARSKGGKKGKVENGLIEVQPVGDINA